MSDSNKFDAEKLADLLAKVQASTGPDRHLDALVEVQARRFSAYAVGLDDSTRAHWNATIDGDVYDTSISYAAPRSTASIDAALALVERIFPGCRFLLSIGFESGAARARLERSPPTWNGVDGYGATPPLAILAALLSALPNTQGKA